MVQHKTIFDLGMNNGDDTAYYLHCGYKVIAIEANSELCRAASIRFQHQIKNKQLKIINQAISNEEKELTFYVNTQNSHWSSLDINWASRNDSQFVEFKTQGITLSSLFEKFGCPYFMKVDIEGADLIAIQQLIGQKSIPEFLSIEDCRYGFEYIDTLRKIGYKKFALSNQALVPQFPDVKRNYEFPAGASGMFGEDLKSAWLEHDDFVENYSTQVRNRTTLQKIADDPNSIWWDIHARV